MANDDDEEFDELLNEYDGPPVQSPQKKVPVAPQQPPRRGRPAVITAQQTTQVQQPQVRAQQPAAAPPQPVDRYVPYVLPQRVGMYDQTTGQPVIEDPDKLDLIVGLLVGLHNKIEKIEQRL